MFVDAFSVFGSVICGTAVSFSEISMSVDVNISGETIYRKNVTFRYE